MIPQEFVEMVVAVGCTGIVFGSITKIIVSFINRPRNLAPAPGQLSGLEDRLARIEHAIDAVSIEVERISEGQRFTTKLLSDRADARASGQIGGDRPAL